VLPKLCTSKQAAEVFKEFMILDGVPKRIWYPKYKGVQHFGPQFGRAKDLEALGSQPEPVVMLG